MSRQYTLKEREDVRQELVRNGMDEDIAAAFAAHGETSLTFQSAMLRVALRQLWETIKASFTRTAA